MRRQNLDLEWSSEGRIAKTASHRCSQNYGIRVYGAHGKMMKATGMQEHPSSALCVNARAIPEWVYSSERVANPLNKIDGGFKEISWDKALGLIADKLTYLKHYYSFARCRIRVAKRILWKGQTPVRQYEFADNPSNERRAR